MLDQKSLCGDATYESSCWQEALEKLRQEDPDIHQQLERILAMQEKSLSRSRISDQIVKSIQANKGRMEDRSIPSPWRHHDEGERAKVKKAMNQILRAVLVFRDVGNSLAAIEPSHAGVAWGGINLVLQVGHQQGLSTRESLKNDMILIYHPSLFSR